MRISEEQLKQRLGSTKNLAALSERSSFSVPPPPANNPPKNSSTPAKKPTTITREIGKPRRGAQLPEPIRDTIGSLAAMKVDTQENIAQAFGINQPMVSQAKTGRVGGRPANVERAEKASERVETIKDTALARLMASLHLLDEEKLAELDAKGLSQVSTNMAKVVSSFNEQTQAGIHTNIVIYAPEMKREEKFKVVEI